FLTAPTCPYEGFSNTPAYDDLLRCLRSPVWFTFDPPGGEAGGTVVARSDRHPGRAVAGASIGLVRLGIVADFVPKRHGAPVRLDPRHRETEDLGRDPDRLLCADARARGRRADARQVVAADPASRTGTLLTPWKKFERSRFGSPASSMRPSTGSISSSQTRSSSRARCAPRQKCGLPRPNASWRFGSRPTSKRPASGN